MTTLANPRDAESLSRLLGDQTLSEPGNAAGDRDMQSLERVLANQPAPPVDESPQARINALARTITQAEVDEFRAEFNQRVPWRRRFFMGINPSDEDIARTLATERLFPGGVLSEPRKPQGFWGPFLGTAAQRFVEVLPPIGERGASLRDFLVDIPKEGAGARLGGIVGEAGTIAVGFLVPSAAPVIFAGKSGKSASDTFDETGNVTAAIGSGAIELVSEAIGYSVIGKIGERTAASLGKEILGRNWNNAAKIITAMTLDAGVEVSEEIVALVGDELIKAAATGRPISEATANIRAQLVPTATDSAAIGVLLFIPSIMSPARRRQFRMAMESRNQKEVRSVLEEEGIDAETIDAIVESIGVEAEDIVGDSEVQASSPIDDVASFVEQANVDDLTQASQEIEAAIAQDDAAAPEAKMTGEQREALDFVKLTIDAELQKRGDAEPDPAIADAPSPQDVLAAQPQEADAFPDEDRTQQQIDAIDALRGALQQEDTDPDFSDPFGPDAQAFIEEQRQKKAQANQKRRESMQRHQEVIREAIAKATPTVQRAIEKMSAKQRTRISGLSRTALDNMIYKAARDQPGLIAVAEVETILSANPTTAGGQSVPDTFMIHPDDLDGMGIAAEQVANRVPVSEDAARIIEVVGRDLYDRAVREAIGGRKGLIESATDMALRNPEGFSPDLVFAAFLRRQLDEDVSAVDILERLGIRAPATRQISVDDAVAAALRGQRVAANVAQRIARQQERSAFRQKLRDMRVQLIAERKEAVQRAREQGRQVADDLRARARTEKENIRRRRSELAGMIRQRMPEELRGRMITALSKVETETQLARATVRIGEILDAHETQEARAELADTLKSIDLRKLKQPFRDQARQIVEAISPERLSKAKRAELEARAEFLARNPDAKLPDSAMRELDRLRQKPVTEMTRDEAVAVTELLQRIVAQNALINKLKIGRRTRERKEIARKMAAELQANMAQRRVLEATGTLEPEGDPGLAGLAFSVVDNMMPRTLARTIGGGEGSITYQVLYRNLKQAMDTWFSQYFAEMDALRQWMAERGFPIDSESVVRWSNSLSGQFGLVRKALTGRESNAEVETHTLESGQVLKITPAERMHILAMMHDQSTYEHVVMKGRSITLGRGEHGRTFNLTDGDLAALQAATTPEQNALVEFIVGRVNGELKQRYAEWSFERYGIDKSREGVHFPRKARLSEQSDVVEFGQEGFSDPHVDSIGINKERMEAATAPIQVLDLFAVFSNFAWQSSGLVNMDPAVRTARLALQSVEVRTALAGVKRGAAVERRFRQVYNGLERMVTGGTEVKGALERVLRSASSNVTKGILGLNLRIALYQPVSYQLASRVMDSRAMMRAAAEGAFYKTDIDDRMYAASPYLRYRAEGSYAGVVNEGGVSGRDLTGLVQNRERLLYLIGMMDRTAIRTIWRAAEIQAEQEGLSGDEAVQRARELAERAVVETQPTFDPMHISGFALEARNRPLARMFTFFRSQTQKNLDMLLEDAAGVRGNGLRGVRRLAGTLAMVVANITALEAISAFYNAILGGDWDDELDKAIVNIPARLAALPIGGDYLAYAARRIMDPGRYAFSPSNPLATAVMGTIEGASGLISGAIHGTTEDRFWRDMERVVRGSALLSGLPIQAIIRDVRQLMKRFDDDGGGRRRRVVR